MSVLIDTERLILDELAIDRDETFIMELLNEPGFLDNIGDRGVRSLDGARGYIENGPLVSYAKHGFGLWRVVEKATGEAIGICGLIKRDGLDFPDLGYAILERAWGRGYAEEAARASLDYGRKILGMGRIVAITVPGNVGSIRVLEKVGFVFDTMIQLPGERDKSTYFVSEA